MRKIKCARCGKFCSVGKADIGELKNVKNYNCPECGTLYFYEGEDIMIDSAFEEAAKA